MSDQLQLGANTQATVTLACFHEPVPVDVAALRRTRDGWYKAVMCPDCRRKRAAVSIAYPTPPSR